MDDLAEAFKVMSAALEDLRTEEDDATVKLSADAIVRTLQFADNQAQRLEHLIRALDQIGNLAASPMVDDEDSWAALRAGIRSSYTMARECEVFDGLFGPPAEPAPYAQQTGASDTGIELF